MSRRVSSESGDQEPLFRALAGGKVRALAGFLDAGADVNVTDADDETLLITASKLEKEDVRSHVIRMLIRYGADVNLADGGGRTPLMHACIRRQREDVVRRIIGTGRCDVNARDDRGNTALLHAVLADNMPAIRILANSAYTKGTLNVNMKNNKGRSPLELAMDAGSTECCYVLVKEFNADTKDIANQADLDVLMKHFKETDPTNVLIPKSKSHTGNGISKSSLRLDKISLHSRSLDKHESTDSNVGSGGEGDNRSPTPMPADDQYPILKPIMASPSSPPGHVRRSYGHSREPMGKYALSPRGAGVEGAHAPRGEGIISVSAVHYGSQVERGTLSPIYTSAGGGARPDDGAGLSLSLPPLSPHSPGEVKSFEFSDIAATGSTTQYSGAGARAKPKKKNESMLKKRSMSSNKRSLGDSPGDQEVAPQQQQQPQQQQHVPVAHSLSRGRLSPLPTVRIPDPYDGDDENQTGQRKTGLPNLKQGKGRRNKKPVDLTRIDAD